MFFFFLDFACDGCSAWNGVTCVIIALRAGELKITTGHRTTYSL